MKKSKLRLEILSLIIVLIFKIFIKKLKKMLLWILIIYWFVLLKIVRVKNGIIKIVVPKLLIVNKVFAFVIL